MAQKEKKIYDLGRDPVGKLFRHYAFLSIAGLGAMSINIMLDGIFIGHAVGSMGLASVNLVLPLFPVLMALGMCFGYGGAILVGIQFGMENREKANEIFNRALIGAVGIGIILTAGCQIFADPIVTLLGATDLLREGVTTYFRTFSAFSAFFCVTLFFEPIVRNDGGPGHVMISLVASSLTNATLNFLFIIILDWGLFGASLATGIAQMVSCLYLASYFFRRKGKLYYMRTTFSGREILRLLKLGAPELGTQICQAVFIVVYNWVIISHIGEIGVAVLGIIMYINELVMLCNYGFGEAVQPIASFNLGARQHGRMRKVYFTAAISSVTFGGILLASFLIVPELFVRLFTSEAELIAMTAKAIKLYYAALMVAGFNMVTIYYLQSVGRPLESTILTLMRNLGFFLLTIFTLPALFGDQGIWLAYPAADLLTLILVVMIIFRNKFYFRKGEPEPLNLYAQTESYGEGD